MTAWQVDLVETNAKDLTFMRWSRVGDQLALGTAKGAEKRDGAARKSVVVLLLHACFTHP
jgi:hypothetical protein